jgi:hypothetical protein
LTREIKFTFLLAPAIELVGSYPNLLSEEDSVLEKEKVLVFFKVLLAVASFRF